MTNILYGLRRGLLILLVLVASLVCSGTREDRIAEDDNPPIVIGQGFDDWATYSPVATDPIGDGTSDGIDFDTLWASSQNGWLMLRFGVGHEIVLQRGNRLTLLIDGDNDSATGWQTGDIGAEFQWIFGERRGYFYEPSGNPIPITPADVAIRAAPTFSGNEYEVAIGLEAVPGAPVAVFTGAQARVVLLDDIPGGDRLPDTQVVTLRVRPPLEVPLPILSVARKDPSHLRILQHNVLEDGIIKRPEFFRRIYRAADPDLLLLGEVYTSNAEEVQQLLQEWLPGQKDDRPWIVIRHQDGSMVASRYPIRQVEGGEDKTGDGFLVQLAEPWDREIFVIHAYAACCDEDSIRQRHCDRIMAFYRDAIQSSLIEPGTPVILAGDFNLVTWRRHYETLRDGAIADTASFGRPFAPDWDGSSFADLNPRLLALPMEYTWRNAEHGFSPGRLDFMLYTDSNLEVGNSFVLDDDGLSDSVRSALGIEPGDCARAADHRPLVGDFFPKPMRMEK
ncbi:endonuclease/exonuclease/phosphatase family protein [Candidatus Neomarinimicrobiota bacterium]